MAELFVDPRYYTKAVTAGIRPIRLYDTTLRDGEQSPGVVFDPQSKLKIATALSDIGCHIIDLGFPVVDPDEREAMRLVLEARRAGQIRTDVDIVLMSRAVDIDVELTAKMLIEDGFSPSDITLLVFTPTSPLHCHYKLRDRLKPLMATGGRPPEPEDYRDATARLLTRAVKRARELGFTSIEAGAEDASRTPLEWLKTILISAVEAGARRLNVADTTGSLTPISTTLLCAELAKTFPEVELVNHFHNDFGLATANVIAAALAGVSTCSVTVNGIGERAGNARLHTVVCALRYLYGIEISGFGYDQLDALSSLVEVESGLPIGANEPIVGINAFSHESGVHTHGVLLEPRLYEPLPCEEVGRTRRFVFGKHSGLHALKWALERGDSALPWLECSGGHLRTLLARVKREAIKRHCDRKTSLRQFIAGHRRQLAGCGLSAEEVGDLARASLTSGNMSAEALDAVDSDSHTAVVRVNSADASPAQKCTGR